MAEVITRVRVYDRQDDRILVLGNADCSFAYRTSLFKSTGARYVVLDVTFRLAAQALSLPVKYAELAAELGVALGERAGVGEVRSAVLKIRARKGMVLNPGDPGHPQRRLLLHQPDHHRRRVRRGGGRRGRPRGRPGAQLRRGRRPGQGPGRLADRARRLRQGLRRPAPARVSTKHTLALVNTGNATTADLLALAREIVSGVHSAYGVTLTPEPILIGVSL